MDVKLAGFRSFSLWQWEKHRVKSLRISETKNQGYTKCWYLWKINRKSRPWSLWKRKKNSLNIFRSSLNNLRSSLQVEANMCWFLLTIWSSFHDFSTSLNVGYGQYYEATKLPTSPVISARPTSSLCQHLHTWLRANLHQPSLLALSVTIYTAETPYTLCLNNFLTASVLPFKNISKIHIIK